jgi:hypothetical protein
MIWLPMPSRGELILVGVKLREIVEVEWIGFLQPATKRGRLASIS